MVQSGLFTMFLDSSFDLPYQSVCVPVLIQYSVNVVVPPAVKQNVSTVLSGDVQGDFVQGGGGDEFVMINTTAASVPAVSPAHTVTCELETLNRKIMEFCMCLYRTECNHYHKIQ